MPRAGNSVRFLGRSGERGHGRSGSRLEKKQGMDEG
jgi:hypothetical protein